MSGNHISAASQSFHSTSVQASIVAMIGSISSWVKSLDYEFIASATAIITLAYIIFAFSMALERRFKQTRYVSREELRSFKQWKRSQLLEELEREEHGADT